jgi:hypothetical protein
VERDAQNEKLPATEQPLHQAKGKTKNEGVNNTFVSGRWAADDGNAAVTEKLWYYQSFHREGEFSRLRHRPLGTHKTGVNDVRFPVGLAVGNKRLTLSAVLLVVILKVLDVEIKQLTPSTVFWR